MHDQIRLKDIISTKKSCLIHIGHLHCRDNDTLIDIHKEAYKTIISHFSKSEFDNKQGDDKFISYANFLLLLYVYIYSSVILPHSYEHMILREIRQDLLPGKCLWFVDASAATTDVSMIGKGRPVPIKKKTNTKDITTKFNSSNSNLLRKLGGLQVMRRGLVVTSLSCTQREIRKQSLESFRVWIQRVANPNSNEVSFN